VGSTRITYSKLRQIQEALCNYWRINEPTEPSLALWMANTTLGFARDALSGKRPQLDPNLEIIAHVLDIAAQAGSTDQPRWFWYLEAALHMNERILGAHVAIRNRKSKLVIDPARRRGRLCGAYSTPHYIAEALVGDVLRALGSAQRATMLDLSVEAGQFPVTVLAKAPASIAVSFYGIDRDQEALRMTRKHFRFAERWRDSARFTLSLTCRDSLLNECPRGWPRQFDVVLGNPPWNASPGKYTEQVREAFRSRLSDHFDHYLAFILRAHALLRPGGLLGVVLPSSFLFNESARRVRELLLDHYDVVSLRIYPRRSFIEIPCLVPVAFLCMKKEISSGPVRQSLIEYHPMPLGGPLKPRTSLICNAVEYWKALPGQPFHPLVRPESARLIHSLHELPRLKDYGSAIKGASVQKRDPVAPEVEFLGFQARDIRPFHACVRGSRKYSRVDARFQTSPSAVYVNAEKVLFQNFRFITQERRLIAAVAGPGNYPVGSASMFVPNDPKDSWFFAALLNSSVANAWFKVRDVSRNIKLELVREVPVPAEKNMKDRVRALAGRCANLRDELHQIGGKCVIGSEHRFADQKASRLLGALRESERMLDEIFYELYNLSRTERRTVAEVANLRIF